MACYEGADVDDKSTKNDPAPNHHLARPQIAADTVDAAVADLESGSGQWSSPEKGVHEHNLQLIHDVVLYLLDGLHAIQFKQQHQQHQQHQHLVKLAATALNAAVPHVLTCIEGNKGVAELLGQYTAVAEELASLQLQLACLHLQSTSVSTREDGKLQHDSINNAAGIAGNSAYNRPVTSHEAASLNSSVSISASTPKEHQHQQQLEEQDPQQQHKQQLDQQDSQPQQQQQRRLHNHHDHALDVGPYIGILEGCIRMYLGASSAACVHRLSDHPLHLSLWLQAQQHAADAACALQATIPPVTPLWTCYKGTVRHPPSVDVLRQVAQLLGQMAQLEVQQNGCPDNVPAWQICKALLAAAGSHKSDGAVYAALLQCSARLFKLCMGTCRAEDRQAYLRQVLGALADDSTEVQDAAGIAVRAALDDNLQHPLLEQLLSSFLRSSQQGSSVPSSECADFARAVAGVLKLQTSVATDKAAQVAAAAAAYLSATCRLLQQGGQQQQQLPRASITEFHADANAGAANANQEGNDSAGITQGPGNGGSVTGRPDARTDIQNSIAAICKVLTGPCPVSIQAASGSHAVDGSLVLTALEALTKQLPSAPLLPSCTCSSSSSSSSSEHLGISQPTKEGLLLLCAELATHWETAPQSGLGSTHLRQEHAIRFLSVVQAIVAAVLEPGQELFAELGGAPYLEVPAGLQDSVQAWHSAAAAAMTAASGLVKHASAALLPHSDAPSAGMNRSSSSASVDGGSSSSSSSSGSGSSSRADARRSHPGVLIEDVTGHPEVREPMKEQLHERLMQTLQTLMMLVATYAHDDRLLTPWTSTAVAATGSGAFSSSAALGVPAGAAALLDALQQLPAAMLIERQGHADRHSNGRSSSGTAKASSSKIGSLNSLSSVRLDSSPNASAVFAVAAPAEVAKQKLLAAWVPLLVPELHQALLSCQPQHLHAAAPSSEPAPPAPPGSAGTFKRAVLARRLAWLVRCLRHPFIGAKLPVILPAILVATDDPSPGVSVYGIWAMHHLATEALAADLQWQRELLLDVAKRLVVGCEESLWHAAFPTAVALTTAIEGKDCRAGGYHMLVSEVLTEAERSLHQRSRRLVFLQAMRALVPAMGLTTTRHLGRLMPLVLEVLQAFDAPSHAAALDLLAVIILNTWPRMPAHAATVWKHLLALYRLEAAEQCAGAGAAGSTPAADTAAAATGPAGGPPVAGPAAHAPAAAADNSNLLNKSKGLGSDSGLGTMGPVSAVGSLESSNAFGKAGHAVDMAADELPGSENEVVVGVYRVVGLLARCGGEGFRLAVEATAAGDVEPADKQLAALVHRCYFQ